MYFILALEMTKKQKIIGDSSRDLQIFLKMYYVWFVLRSFK